MDLKSVVSDDFSIMLDVMSQLAKKHGLKRLKVGEIEIEFWNKESLSSTGPVVPQGSLLTQENSAEDVDDLFYSVRG